DRGGGAAAGVAQALRFEVEGRRRDGRDRIGRTGDRAVARSALVGDRLERGGGADVNRAGINRAGRLARRAAVGGVADRGAAGGVGDAHALRAGVGAASRAEGGRGDRTAAATAAGAATLPEVNVVPRGGDRGRAAVRPIRAALVIDRGLAIGQGLHHLAIDIDDDGVRAHVRDRVDPIGGADREGTQRLAGRDFIERIVVFDRQHLPRAAIYVECLLNADVGAAEA